MKRLIGSFVLATAVALLAVAAAFSSSPNQRQTYLPLVSNPPPTPTPTATPSPGALTWSLRAEIPYWIYPVFGTAVANGQIYVLGPYAPIDRGDGNVYAVVYDPTSNIWTMRSGHVANPMTAGCCGATGVAAARNDKIYAVIGSPGANPTTLEYDPASDTWATRAPIPTPVQSFGWVAAPNGKLYAIGGEDLSSNPVSLVQIYNPSRNSWSLGASAPTTFVSPTVAATSDGKVYAFTAESGIYDTATNAWTTGPWYYLQSYGMGAVQAVDGKIYMAGGPPPAGSSLVSSNTVLSYDPATNIWMNQTPLLVGDLGPSHVVLNGTNLYEMGGQFAEGYGWDQRLEEATISTTTSSASWTGANRPSTNLITAR